MTVEDFAQGVRGEAPHCGFTGQPHYLDLLGVGEGH